MLNAYSNVNSNISINRLGVNQANLQQHMSRISSGYKVNTAYDNASDMAVNNSLTAKINSNDMAIRNANDAISVVQTAEGAVSQIIQNFQRIREISILSINDVKDDATRQKIQVEVDGLTTEIVHMAEYTEFNGKNLLTGGQSLTFTVGANSSKDSQVSFIASDLGSKIDLTSNPTTGQSNYHLDVSTRSAAEQSLKDVTNMLEFLNTERTRYGGILNRMESTINPLLKYNTELKASRSRIVDADVAAETAALTRAQILQQASISNTTTINKMPEAISSLLK